MRKFWLALWEERVLFSVGHVSLEFKAADLWVGLFIRRDWAFPDITDMWICVVPCFPIHIWW